MTKRFALLDKDGVILGTINIPDNAVFDKPHHAPHVEIGSDDLAITGTLYGSEVPKGQELRLNDPPLAEGKRHLFNLFRR